MLAESTVPTALPEVNEPHHEPGVGELEEMMDSADPQPGRSSLRTSTSKIANLRAAFEKDLDSEPAAPKRRLKSADRSTEGAQQEIAELEKELTRVKDDLQKEQELRIAFEDKCTALEDELDGAQRKSDEEMAASKADWEHTSQALMQDRATAVERMQQHEAEAKIHKDEASGYQRQLSDLKRNISQSTRVDGQVSDATLSQEMRILHHEIQNWVVNNFRRPRRDMEPDELCEILDRVAQPPHQALLRPMYQAFDRSAKLSIYQATAVSYLMDIFNDPLLFGLPSEPAWRSHLWETQTALSTLLEAVAYNKWRASTLDTLRQSSSIGPSILNASTLLAAQICTTLTALTDSEPDVPARRASLDLILAHAVALAHTFRVQRPGYEFVWPLAGQVFAPELMDDIRAEEREDTTTTTPAAAVKKRRVVLCATFPSVFKIGDEVGAHMHLRNILVKARVLCREEIAVVVVEEE